MITIGSLKLIRWADGKRNLRVVIPGYDMDGAPKLRYGWECFWVSHFGADRTEYTYRKKVA